MPQCEMCGADKPSLTTAKVEGAELDLCDECKDFGTEVQTSTESTTSTKYSTSDSSSGESSGSQSSTATGSSTSGGSSASRRRDMFDDMDELVPDYDERIREAREAAGLSQEDLAKSLNEKASLIRKLERGDMLPSDAVQRKIERELDVSLSAGGGDEDADWETDSSPTTTLGDVVKRKD